MKFNTVLLSSILWLCSFLIYGQSGESYLLKGKIIDDDLNDGLPGATIKIADSQSGTVTDFDGNFTLQVKQGDVLNISFIGYEPQEVIVNGQTEINVTLYLDVQSLDEVIVSGYGLIRKSDQTGAVSSVDMDDIKSIAVSDVAQAMQGRIAGVQITPESGAPGAETVIRIRGVGTVTGSADPLYVVDGVIVNDINFLAQNDIKSIEIMKDASVASLYGSRASNGVVVIQTKQGEKGKMQINVASQYGIQNMWNKPEFTNAQEYFILNGLAGGGNVTAIEQGLKNLEESPLAEDNNWLELVSRTGQRQQHSISFSGGSDNITYRLSTNYFDEKGIIINSDFKRINVLNDITFKINDRLDFRSNIIYSNVNRNVQDTNEDNDSGLFRKLTLQSPASQLYDELGFLTDNPYRLAIDRTDERKVNNLQAKFFLNYEIIDNLKFTSRFSLDQKRIDKFLFVKPGTSVNQTLQPNNVAPITEESDLVIKGLWEQVLTYYKTIDKHYLSFTGAFSLEGQQNKGVLGKGSSYLGRSETAADLDNAFRNLNVSGGESAWRQMGVVFRSNYTFDNKYIFQVNLRADGSSRFSKGSRWGYFPSASAAWVFTDDLLPGNRFLQNGKLRLSFGSVGNNSIGNYENTTTLTSQASNADIIYAYGANEDFNYYPGYAAVEIGNESISWERTQSFNVGMDFDFLGHFFVTTDVFRRKTTDMLLNIPVPLSVGFQSTPRRNIGAVVNDGIELTLAYKQQIGDFYLDISGNGTVVKNRVTELGTNNDPVFGGNISKVLPVNLGFGTKTVVGRPVGSFFGYVVDGIDSLGNFAFKDLNGDGNFSPDDRTFLGNPIPDLTYGGVINLGYKNFDLVAQLQGVYGSSVFNTLRYHTHGLNGTPAFSSTLDHIWTQPMDFEGSTLPQDIIDRFANGTTNTLPIGTNQDLDESYRYASDFYIEDASYLRVKNVQLGYSFGNEFLDRMKVSSMRLYLSAQNLFTFTKYEGFDPEVGSGGITGGGIDYGSYPQSRVFIVGVNLSL